MARALSTTVSLGSLQIDRITVAQAVTTVEEKLQAGQGGHIATPNVDIVAQCRRDPGLARLINDCELVTCDGAPLLWASRLAGTPLPERVAGSDLVWELAQRASDRGWKLALLGGTPDPTALPTQRAGDVLERRYPGLKVVGRWCPPLGFDKDQSQWEALVRRLSETQPDVVYVGLGFPKQESVIANLRAHAPRTWFLGCGASIDFIAGYRQRAPHWMRRYGLEWLHRMMSEPRRLARRYLINDAPIALTLMGRAVRTRWTK
ncbi:WecB/TagA/CpsF family glycosyltransferase [Haloglycomyces albus]|uniref:WecB/TagA/CpsF family glycosyltransferase n=1 Tax=Haloglycomyces albus TaxID=526067 RepID=UPI00046D69D7|nr:WecB/TagA/CpsF family glycosyltransferase [Haloglycomyces albus]